MHNGCLVCLCLFVAFHGVPLVRVDNRESYFFLKHTHANRQRLRLGRLRRRIRPQPSIRACHMYVTSATLSVILAVDVSNLAAHNPVDIYTYIIDLCAPAAGVVVVWPARKSLCLSLSLSRSPTPPVIPNFRHKLFN